MRYEWDPGKNARNIRERGIDFADVPRLFDAPHLLFSRWPQSYPERRVMTLGHLDGVPLVVVYHQKTTDLRRLISARVAKRKERKLYAQAFPAGG